MNLTQYALTYQAALRDHRLTRQEASLRRGYELGREAVTSGISLLELARIHHEALLYLLSQTPPAEDVVESAQDFFIEAVSAFEMVRRGYDEAREAAVLQESKLQMLRTLSTFLADSSLASTSTQPLQEVLQLITEHGREMVGARLCTVELTGYEWSLNAAAYSDDPSDRGLEEPQLVEVPPSSSFRVAIHTDLKALDGRVLGSIRVMDAPTRVFSAVDEAALRHLAQMASAVIERVRLYRLQQKDPRPERAGRGSPKEQGSSEK